MPKNVSATRLFAGQAALSPVRLIVIVLLISGIVLVPGTIPVLATGTNCVTSTSPLGTYTVKPCIDGPADGATVGGAQTVSASYSTTGANPGVAKLIFYLDGEYLITDYATPYTFGLETNRWIDGSHILAVAALMKDGYTSQLSSITLTFNNGVTQPPVNTNTFTPTSGTTPSSGQPFVLAAAGDGADGATNAGNVTNLINSWSPNLFLYLGDVYEKGSFTEFSNWYGSASTFYGRFRLITDPVVGNHEYEHGVAPGYFDYWDNVPSYYSYDAAGWHMIALNSNCGLLHICDVGQAEYQWLLNDLSSHNNTCTIAYFHHPVYNVGPEGYATAMNAIWALMAQHGVDIVLSGHDHDYQRWMPLDGNGDPSPTGMTQFVVGSGGHGIQQFTVTDSRLAVGFDTSPNSFGGLRMELNQDGAGYQFINYQGKVLDSGAITCNGAATDTTAPSAPGNMTATANSSTQVNLSWNASTDNVGVVGYDIYRDGALLTSVGTVTSYSDTDLTQGASYNYQVKARDVAGNASAFSTTATVTMPSLLFGDGFESGELSAWTSNTNFTVQQQERYAGVYAARATSTGTAASFASKTLSATQSDLYYSLRFKVISKGATSAYLQRFRTSANGAILGIFVSSTGRLMYRNDVAASNSATGPLVSSGAWHELQTHVHIDPTVSASGQIEVWLDGALVSALSTSATLGTSPIGRVQLGDSSTSDIYDVALDEVGVNTSSIDTSDAQAPSAPTGVAAIANAPNSVNLSWNAATDNISVSGYDLYRNGAPLATLGAVTSYIDTPVTPAFTYHYQVRARDAAGNVSALSTEAIVTTPADTTGPSVTLTAPADGASVSANVTLSADATDNVDIEDVDFLVNGTIIGTVGEGGPYNLVWNSTTVPDAPVTITARAVDTSGNETDDTVTVNVNNAGGDTTPPTVPANFTATAAGSSRVDLSWSASTDNVAVTGYDIYRDGAALASIGASTTYSDTNVTVGATYQYQVRARDAAGNTSALMAAAAVTIPALLFSSGFESGNLSNWINQGNGLTAQQQAVLEGAYAAEASSTGPASWAYTQLATAKSNLYSRIWFKIISKGANNVNLLRFRTAANGAILGVFVSSTGKLGITNDAGGGSTTSTTSVSTGVWHSLQAHVNITTGQVDVWLDGAPVGGLNQTLNLGATTVGRLQLGESSTGRTYDVAFDEVAYDTSFIQSSSTPYTLIDAGPSGLTTNNAASFSFSATAAGATFQCSLDEAAFGACTSPQAFTGLADGAHTFAVQATDAAANADPTPASRTWTVDTTAPTVANVAPADSATGVPITITVGIVFAEPMNQASFTTSSFTLVPQGDTTPIAATISYDQATDKATLHPSAALAYFTTYVATVKGDAGGATDQAGNPLPADKIWSFTTVAPDTASPTVTLTAPADGATVSGSVALTADATDDVAVDHVDFQVNGQVVGIDSSAPYSINWDTTTSTNGPATITAQAVDSANNATISAASNVTVANDATPPSVPSNLAASAISSGRVDLTWTAATDDMGVTSYDIYRDGTLLTSVGAVTSYSDTTTDPATTYQYQVLARDAAGHTSALSAPASATTPAALFSDSFESGNLLGWTAVNGLVVQQQQVHTGSNAAQATSNGTAVANARKQFGTAQYELYFSTWFKILSQGNNSAYLQRFIKADTFSALGVYVSSTGKLGYRNDISGASNTSTQNVSQNVWHQVKTHIRIDSSGGLGLVELWFDGAQTPVLSKAEALDNAPIKNIQLGDSTVGNVYSVAFDDVIVTTPADPTPPTVALTAPAGGALINGIVTLAATANDNIGVDHVDFLVNSTVVGSTSTAPYSVSWDSATIADGSATITARAVDSANNVTMSAGANVAVDNTPPNTTITAGPAALITSSTVSLSFSSSEAGSTFQCSLDSVAFSTCTSPKTYTSLADGLHMFEVKATDATGNTAATPASTMWTIDTVAPTITSVTPADGATGVLPTSDVTSVFEEDMDPATLTSATFTVRTKQGNNPVAATVSYDPIARRATVHPNVSLASLTTYRATIRGGVGGAKDLAGNPLAADFVWNFTTNQSDTTPPTVSLTAPAAGASVAGNVTISANATDNVAVDHVDFLADNVVVGTDTTSPYSISWNSATHADGTTNIIARAVDTATNQATTTARSVTVDNTAPDTTITSGPSGTVSSTTASFSFTATEGSVTFACSLDGAAFSSCSSGISYSGLANGSHSFQVRATDAAGNVDTTPASRTWAVSAIVPDTSITSGPSGTVSSTSASFSFTSSQAGSTFECSLDGATFSSCTSPKAYTGLANGSHTFQVRAIYIGNSDPTPASSTWIIDTIAPDTTITNGSSGSVNSSSASFSFSATETGSTFECKLDSATFAACTSPQSYTGLANGSHSFQVRATDAAGNTDATPASTTWTVDTTAPTSVAVTAPGNGASVTGQVTISASASDNVRVVQVRFFIDGVLFDTDTSAPFSTNWNTKKVATGTHTIYVIADDAAGNTTQSATITVTVR